MIRTYVVHNDHHDWCDENFYSTIELVTDNLTLAKARVEELFTSENYSPDVDTVTVEVWENDIYIGYVDFDIAPVKTYNLKWKNEITIDNK